MRVDWSRFSAITVGTAGIVLSLYLLCRFALPLFFPFVLAFLLAFLLRPLILFLTKLTARPQKFIAVLVMTAALISLGGFLYFLGSRILLELRNLLDFLISDSANPSGRLAQLRDFVENFLDRVPFFSRLQSSGFLSLFVDDPRAFFAERFRAMLIRLSEGMTAAVGSFLRLLPSLALSLLVFVISCFYFAVDFESVCRGAIRCLPASLVKHLPLWRARVGEGMRRYVRAYFLLFLLTLAELIVGFLALGVDYWLLLAFLTAVLDVLPVLGVGTVLLPFALLSFATGNTLRGAGLLALYVVITVVRQIAEPHMVGKSLGLHPVLMLISFYAGLKLFGVLGVFVGPALALFIKSALERSAASQAEKQKEPA